jgi:SAM-dependent methyltransferase
VSFEPAYAGTPPWDIDHPQPAFVRLAAEGRIGGRVLDVGCGTGENALYLARLGHRVVGVDAAPSAIRKARHKSEERGIVVTFLVGDALELAALEGLGEPFETAIDSGLFHVFDDRERPIFAESVASVVRAGGTYHMLCFSELEPPGWGPRRVTQQEIRETFSRGWRVDSIEQAYFETLMPGGRVHAWLASITRL